MTNKAFESKNICVKWYSLEIQILINAKIILNMENFNFLNF